MINSVLKPTIQNFSSGFSVFIGMGAKDCELGYQVSLGPSYSYDSFLVSFHPGSLMYERVKLFGEALVFIMLPDGQIFNGFLRDPNEESALLLLQFGNLAVDDYFLEPCIKPIT
jgi:hypothetical protein